MVDQEAADDEAQPGARADHRGHHPKAVADPPRGKQGADEAEGQGKRGRSGALHRARQEQDREVPCEGRQHGAGAEDGE
nr:hypothetical protein [Streptomyces sp. V4I23]